MSEKKEMKRQVNSVELQEAATIILDALHKKNIDYFVGIFAMQVLVESAKKEFNYQSEIHTHKVEVH